MHVLKMQKMSPWRQIAIDIGADIEKGPWIAGGAARRLYQNELDTDSFAQGDIDIFLPTDHYEEVLNRVTKIINLYATLGNWSPNIFSLETRIVKPQSITTTTVMRIGGSERRVQIVGKGHADLKSLFGSFDFTVTQFAASGQFLACTEIASQDLKEKKLDLVQPAQPIKRGTPHRVRKYCFYGFVPAPGVLRWASGIDHQKVDSDMRVIPEGANAY